MSEQRDFCLGASVSARHTSEMNGRISDWGQHSELHTCGENGILSIYMYIWYVHILYIHPALFVHDAIFPHCTLVYVSLVPSSRAPPSKKWSRERSRISWAYFLNVEGSMRLRDR